MLQPLLSFVQTHLVLVSMLVLACILIMGGVFALRSFIVTQRLHYLSMEIITHDPKTFQQTHLIECHACKSKRHVSHYRYGATDKGRAVYLCYLCLPRLENHIDAALHMAQAARPQEQPKDAAYAQFQAWTGHAGHAQAQPTQRQSSRIPGRASRERRW